VERAHKRIARRSPREASRPGSDRRQTEGARNTHRFGRFTSPPSKKWEGASSWARPNGPTLAQVCVPLRRKVLGRSPTQPYIDADLRSDAMVTWVLHDWRGNPFRFVVCRSSIQGAMALQLRVSNHRWQRKQG
jgi:hypothetical protein